MEYENYGDFYQAITRSGFIFRFDIEDFHLVNQYTWCENNGYAMTWDSKLKKNIYLHQLIMQNHNPDLVVDHINTHRCDNRRKNLRLVTRQENSRNRAARNNKYGCPGVTWNSTRETYQAIIRVDGKNKMLGQSKNLDIVIQLRKQAEKDYF